MAQENFDNSTVSNSKLYMLRCVIAMAHADGIVTSEEHAYMNAITNRIPLTTEQRKILEDDFQNAQDIGNLFRHINDPRYRAQVGYFARLMAFKDGVLHPSEDDLLNRIHALTTDGLDMKAIRAEVKQVADKEMFLQDIKMDHNRPIKGWLELLDRALLKMGIDLIRD